MPIKTQNPSHDFTKSKPFEITFGRKSATEQSRMMKTTLIFVLVTMLWAGAESQSCTNVIISMSPCLNYITGNSSTPSSGCCSQLASVVRSQPQCLCQVFNGGSSPGLNINQAQALALPSACNVQTPPLSRCNAASPPDSPADSPAGTTESPETTRSEGGFTPEGLSDGRSLQSSNSLIFFILLITTFVSAMAAN